MEIIKLIDKKEDAKLYQWDLDRRVKITLPEGIEADEVHFAHLKDREALVVRIEDIDGILVADIPNILLQSNQQYIKAWLVSGNQTICTRNLTVIERAKPADYVYTETEILSYRKLSEEMLEQLKKLEEEISKLSNEKISNPTTAEVGQILEVEEIDENGKPIKWKAVDKPTDGADLDVQINGESIVKDGVADIPMTNISNGTAGLVKVDYLITGSPSGLNVSKNGVVFVRLAENGGIDSRGGYDCVLSVQKLDYAVKQAMCDGQGAEWTPEEKASARERMGAVDSGVEITSGEPTKESTVLTVDPNAEEVNLYTAEEIDAKFASLVNGNEVAY